MGILGAVIASLPLTLAYLVLGVPIEDRGGAVPLQLLPFVLFIALSANLYEEILFRGYLYGWLTREEGMKPAPAGLPSGADRPAQLDLTVSRLRPNNVDGAPQVRLATLH